MTYHVATMTGFRGVARVDDKLSMGAIALGLQQQLLSGRLKLEIDWGFTVRQRGALMVPV
ncbi:hypothetical protein [Parathermosynechococcus lividus]|uniref:hypothetical protein n=1 Tax=Parathermosynechococcus lividus TaxID=33070 RepID=UPI0012FD5A79|nr:hypothetical protein [Thermostichus lividus]